MKEEWTILLNVNPSYIDGSNIIGKNTIYIGNKDNLYNSENITVIGFAKIYNEYELCKKLELPKIVHSLQMLVELYKKFGYEDMLELLEGDFSFVLLDYNIFGEESWIYIAKDPYGIFPLYYYENPGIDLKKVQFEFETKQYGFSSQSYSDKNIYRSFIAGSYQRYSHSYKVSATWKQNYRPRSFYKLPFCSILNEGDDKKNVNEHITTQVAISIRKRMEWIQYKNPDDIKNLKIGILCLYKQTIESEEESNNFEFEVCKKGIQTYIENNNCFEFVSISPDNIQNEDNSAIFEWAKIVSFSNDDNKYNMNFILQVEYIEKEYPTIITKIKNLLKSNDPYIIRSHFIPMIIAKHISEKMPDLKHVFLAEPFTYDWLDKKYLARRKIVSQIYLDENMKGWTQIFISFGINLYFPYLDRVLIQNIEPPSAL